MNTVLKYPGSKWSIADWIIANFPSNYEKLTYLEPFFGSGAVFFNKKRSMIETINDLDGNVVNLFKQIRDNPEALSRAIKLTPWARDEYKNSYEMTGETLEDARRFMVRCWQAIGTKTSDISGWSNNIKPIDSGLSRWSRLHEEILRTAQRLSNEKLNLVQIENQPAVDLIKRYNRKEVLIYLDPPYVLKTRSGRIYKHEMSNEQHEELLKSVLEHKGYVIISGYDNDIYREYLKDWKRETRTASTEMGGKGTEVIWMNYEPSAEQLRLTI